MPQKTWNCRRRYHEKSEVPRLLNRPKSLVFAFSVNPPSSPLLFNSDTLYLMVAQIPKVPKPRCGSGQKGGGQSKPFDSAHLFFDGFGNDLTRDFTKDLPRIFARILPRIYQGIYQGFPFTKDVGGCSFVDLICIHIYDLCKIIYNI